MIDKILFLLLLLSIHTAPTTISDHGPYFHLIHVDIVTPSGQHNTATVIAYNIHQQSSSTTKTALTTHQLQCKSSSSSVPPHPLPPPLRYHNELLLPSSSLILPPRILPSPIRIATRSSSQKDDQLTIGLYVVDYMKGGEANERLRHVDWTGCSFVHSDPGESSGEITAAVVPLDSIRTERTVRVFWAEDENDENDENDDNHHHHHHDHQEDPLHFTYGTPSDLDATFAKYMVTQLSLDPQKQDEQQHEMLSTSSTSTTTVTTLLEIASKDQTTTSRGCDDDGSQQCANNKLASELWIRVVGLSHSNVTAAPLPPPLSTRRPCVCVDSSLSDCISLPDHERGLIEHLQFEDTQGTNAAIVLSNHNVFATSRDPVLSNERMIVYGADDPNHSRRAAVWIGTTMFYGQSSFAVNDRINLRNFLQRGNIGIFQIIEIHGPDMTTRGPDGTTPGVLVLLANLPPSDAEPGQIQSLVYESNRQGALVTGCFGKTAGPTTKREAIVIYGASASLVVGTESESKSKSESQATWVRFPPSFHADEYEINELVRLTNFQHAGNVGVFRIEAKPSKNVVSLKNVRDCASTNLLCTGTLDKLLREARAARIHDMALRPEKQPQTACPSDCHGHGRMETKGASGSNNGNNDNNIDNNACECDAGFDPSTCCLVKKKKTKIKILDDDLHCPSSLPNKPCSDHGVCDSSTGLCACDNSWISSDCSQPMLPCPNKCTGHGVCEATSGTCHCDDSWRGVDCAVSDVFCPHDCCGFQHGVCNHNTGRCNCKSGYSGLDCCSVNIPCCRGCSSHGTCDGTDGSCTCHEGWGGDFSKCCGERLCPKDCHADEKHGRCNVKTGECACEPSWTGISCETSAIPCPDDCSGHGKCDVSSGACTCDDDWSSIDCGIPHVPCPCPAGTDGICDTTIGKMNCNRMDAIGVCCKTEPCYRNCSGSSHGRCNEKIGLCVCRRAWMGVDCSVPKCGEHGTMLADGSCRADEHYFSPIQVGIFF